MTQEISKIASMFEWIQFHHDPDAVTAVVLTDDGAVTDKWFPMTDNEGIGFLVAPTILAGSGITLIDLIGNTEEDGSGTDVLVVSSGVLTVDAVGKYGFLEASAEMIAQAGVDAGEVLVSATVRITTADATDEAMVSVLFPEPRFGRDALTATNQ